LLIIIIIIIIIIIGKRIVDFLGGGAKLEIWSWGTHSRLHGWVQQLLND